MRLSLQITAIFIAVGLGALSVTLLHDPMALIPHPPYGRWILVRLLLLASLAALGILLVFGVVDDREDIDNPDGSLDQAIFWRVVGLAFLISALASATFVAVSALVDYLERGWAIGGSTQALFVGALASHGILDAFHGQLIANPGVPVWWPAFCLAFDGVAAGYLACLLLCE